MENNLKNILVRIDKLEKAVFRTGKKTTPILVDSFTGPKGGILMLISRKFFDAKRSLEEIHEKLDKSDYRYKKIVVYTTLKRLSAQKGPLVVLTEQGQKVYVKRK